MFKEIEEKLAKLMQKQSYVIQNRESYKKTYTERIKTSKGTWTYFFGVKVGLLPKYKNVIRTEFDKAAYEAELNKIQNQINSAYEEFDSITAPLKTQLNQKKTQLRNMQMEIGQKSFKSSLLGRDSRQLESEVQELQNQLSNQKNKTLQIQSQINQNNNILQNFHHKITQEEQLKLSLERRKSDYKEKITSIQKDINNFPTKIDTTITSLSPTERSGILFHYAQIENPDAVIICEKIFSQDINKEYLAYLAIINSNEAILDVAIKLGADFSNTLVENQTLVQTALQAGIFEEKILELNPSLDTTIVQSIKNSDKHSLVKLMEITPEALKIEVEGNSLSSLMEESDSISLTEMLFPETNYDIENDNFILQETVDIEQQFIKVINHF